VRCPLLLETVGILRGGDSRAVQCNLARHLQPGERTLVAPFRRVGSLAPQEFRVWAVSVALAHLRRSAFDGVDQRGCYPTTGRLVDEVGRLVCTVSLAKLTLGGCVRWRWRWCSILMSAASVAWFVDALAARKSYAAEFYASLRQGYLDLSSPLIDFTPDQVWCRLVSLNSCAVLQASLTRLVLDVIIVICRLFLSKRPL